MRRYKALQNTAFTSVRPPDKAPRGDESQGWMSFTDNGAPILSP